MFYFFNYTTCEINSYNWFKPKYNFDSFISKTMGLMNRGKLNSKNNYLIYFGPDRM